MNYDNLKFPKQGKKKRKKPKPGKYLCKKQKNSIIEGDEKGTCYICGSHINIENHHIFFGHGNRKNSDWYGSKEDDSFKVATSDDASIAVSFQMS